MPSISFPIDLVSNGSIQKIECPNILTISLYTYHYIYMSKTKKEKIIFKICIIKGSDCITEGPENLFVKNTNKCKPCHNAINRIFYKKNKEKISKQKKIYHKEYVRRENVKARRREYKKTDKYRKYAREYMKKKLQNDLVERLKTNIRNRIRHSVKKRNESSMDLIGTSIKTLIEWLEFNFDENMTWDNYGSHWHIDHIKPCSSFDLTKESERKECFSWMNVAPMEARKNESKYAKIDDKLIKY
nr:hypothetical protein [Megavirus caiporensis]